LFLSAKPARILAELPIALPRPRDPVSPEFMALRSQCMHWLHAPSGGQMPAQGKLNHTENR
jgi:ABC-type nitrate/sulfonate/bicarbonate transport system ATPase subunit